MGETLERDESAPAADVAQILYSLQATWSSVSAVGARLPTWSPLLTTPNHPEYPAQHGCITSALAQVISTALGTDNINATIPGAEGGATALTTSQTFATVHDLNAQLVNARVWAGLHFRNSVLAGETLGTRVAD